jgi:hypothetical protein
MSVKSLRCATGYIEIVERGRQGSKGDVGSLPSGGLTGEVLSKTSNLDEDVDWLPITGDNSTEGNIPVKENGALENSGLYINGDGDFQTEKKIIAESGFETTGATIGLGESMRIEASGPQLVLHSLVTGTHYEVPYQSIDKTGSGDLFTVKSGAEQNAVIQPVFDTPLTSPVSVGSTALYNQITNAIWIKTTGDVTNYRFQVTSDASGEPIITYPDIYRYERGEGIDIIGAGDHKIDLFYNDKASPLRTLQGEDFTLTVDWDLSIGTILGTSVNNEPYYGADFQIFEMKTIALIEDLSVQSGNRGFFVDEAALNAAIPVGNDGDSAVVLTPSNNIFIWNDTGGTWDDTGIPAGGDMFQAIYDPLTKSVDVYDMDNMDESGTKKVYTNTERLKLQGIEADAEENQTPAEIKVAYESNVDTNAFDDAEMSKLGGIEAEAEVNRSNADLKVDYESNLNTNAFTDAEQSAIVTNSAKTSFPGWDVNPDHAVTVEPTGYPLDLLTGEIDLASSILSFDDGTRTFSITPTGSDFSLYQAGIKYTFSTPQTVQIADVEGEHFIYFENGVLSVTSSLNLNIIYSKPFTAGVYWNQLDQEAIYLGEERHGLKMDGHTHVRLHQKDGTIYLNGLALTGFTIGTGTIDGDAQFGGDAGEIKDEDILLTKGAISNLVGFPIMYKLGSLGDWKREFNTGFSILNTGTGRMAWNEFTGSTWQKTEVLDNNYALIHIFATNDVNYPFTSFMGQSQYTTKTDAKNGAHDELIELITGLPAAEFVAVGSVVFQSSDSFVNAVKSMVVETGNNDTYIDWRASDISFNTKPLSSEAVNTNQFVNITEDDDTTGYLRDKLTDNGNVTFTVENAGGVETMKADASAVPSEYGELFMTVVGNGSLGVVPSKIVWDTNGVSQGITVDVANDRINILSTAVHKIEFVGSALIKRNEIYTFHIYVNGLKVADLGERYTTIDNTIITMGFSRLISLSAGDYVEIYGECEATKDFDMSPGAGFNIVKI